jgi:hypothetical protein
MANKHHPAPDPRQPQFSQPLVYHIRLAGHLGPDWAGWFDGLTITLQDNGETLLAGPVVDQAALHGVLRKVRDAGIPLLSVVCLNPDHSDSKANRPTAP